MFRAAFMQRAYALKLGAGDVLANSQADPYLSQAVLDLQFGHSQRVGYDVATKVLAQLQRVGSWLFASTSPAPPSSSDCFSCCSSQPAISLFARRLDSTQTDAPVASRFGAASA